MLKLTCAALVSLTLAIGAVRSADAKVYQVLYRSSTETSRIPNLSFLPDGEQICGFKAIFVDESNDADFEVRLLRHRIVAGGSLSSFDRPHVMALIRSSGSAVGVQKKSAPAIQGALINTATYFYSWDFFFLGDPEFGGIDMIGVQIDVQPTCTP